MLCHFSNFVGISNLNKTTLLSWFSMLRPNVKFRTICVEVNINSYLMRRITWKIKGKNRKIDQIESKSFVIKDPAHQCAFKQEKLCKQAKV